MKLNPHLIPFSTARSYLAVAPHQENDWHRTHPGGLFLRTVRTRADTPFVALLIPLKSNGEVLEFNNYSMSPDCFVAETSIGSIEFTFQNEETVLLRASNPELGLRLDFVSKGLMSQFLFPVPRPGEATPDGTLILANANKNRARFLLAAQAGKFIPCDPEWDGRCSDNMSVDIFANGDGKAFSFAIKEYLGEWDGIVPEFDFDKARAERANAFEEFLSGIPTCAPEFEQTRKEAAYLLWSCIVGKSGILGRDVMLMSKNWMDRVWSWDHCFNAMALADGHPQKAWDQLLAPFDLQGEDGSLPDFISEGKTLRGYVKPPIHGWTLRKLLSKVNPSEKQLNEAYERISRWTNWWHTRRDRNGNGLCEYDHGNDSGWDNSTAYLNLPPTETPDLATFLSIQADVLADIATRLNKPQSEIEAWKEISEQQIKNMLNILFDETGKPMARQAYTGKTSSPETLLLRVPVLLGNKLPNHILENLLNDLRSDKFLTEWGYATESPASPYYVNDGYWRGPIWAPSTYIIYEGLRACGEDKLAKHIATQFCKMCAKSGFAENFDAKTGEGLRDRAYTWTAAVFVVLASDLKKEQQA
jgi:hypothetical protein